MKNIVIIGGGAGGYTCAIRAAQLGQKVVLIEEDKLGGTCLNRGCIPAKALLESSEFFAKAADNPFGVIFSQAEFSFDKAYGRSFEITQKLKNGIHSLISSNGIEFVNAKAVIKDKNTVSAGGKDFFADYIVIASGAVPSFPPVKGIELAWTSDDALRGGYGSFDSIAIVGGGVIGTEFATFFSETGKNVTIVEALDGILAQFGSDISKYSAMSLKKKGVKILTGAMLKSVEDAGGGFILKIEAKGNITELKADKVLCCTGRKAVEVGGSYEAGIKFDRGYIVDGRLRTTAENIYAAGDCVKGNIQLAHNAAAQGERIAAEIAGEKTHKIGVVPSCVYCHPNAGSVGVTAQEERETEIGRFNMGGNGKAMTAGDAFGFIKAAFDKETEKLIGAEAVCHNASELLGGIANLIDLGATRGDILSTVYPHPTVSEAFREAAEDSIGRSIHTVYRKRLT